MKIETQTAITVNQARDIVASGAAQEGHGKCLMSRRQFLLTSGATSVVMVSAAPGLAATPAMVSTYPRQKIAKLSQLKADQPVDFSYPDKGAFSESMVVKLGIEAGGGVVPGLFKGQAHQCLGAGKIDVSRQQLVLVGEVYVFQVHGEIL